jgi:hypothetical protein
MAAVQPEPWLRTLITINNKTVSPVFSHRYKSVRTSLSHGVESLLYLAEGCYNTVTGVFF